MYVCVPDVVQSPEKSVGSPELEAQTAVYCHVGVGNQTWALLTRKSYIQPPNYTFYRRLWTSGDFYIWISPLFLPHVRMHSCKHAHKIKMSLVSLLARMPFLHPSLTTTISCWPHPSGRVLGFSRGTELIDWVYIYNLYILNVLLEIAYRLWSGPASPATAVYQKKF